MSSNFDPVLRFVRMSARAGDGTMSARGVSMNGVSRKIGVPRRADRGGGGAKYSAMRDPKNEALLLERRPAAEGGGERAKAASFAQLARGSWQDARSRDFNYRTLNV